MADLDTPIAIEARDLLPETWLALAEAESFGADALQRRHDRVVGRIFGTVLDATDQAALDSIVIEYAGKRLALALIDPAIDYWSKQIESRTVGDRESVSYKDRVEDLKDLAKRWTVDLATMYLDAEALLPVLASHAVDAPRVVQAGDTVVQATPDPFGIGPLFGPPETTTTGG